jgi:ADP-heptose:LPS heptosyltransferase
MRIGLPAGVGDVSWAWSKLYHRRGAIDVIEVCDGWPQRTVPYLECLFPSVDTSPHFGYGDFNYQTIQLFTKSNGIQNPTWEHLWENFEGHHRVLLEPNEHLELGRRLELWMPDVATEFHYPLYTAHAAQSMREKLHRAFSDAGAKGEMLVGISCASYRGSEAWKTWGVDEWRFVLQKMLSRGYQPVLLGGFWDDLTYTLACELNLPELVGKTSMAECVELLRILPAYVGFSSGLNVIRTVVDRPAFALWPDHQQELSTSWVPPHMLESHRYVASLWRDPEQVWAPMGQFLRLCEEEGDRDAEREKVQRQEHGAQRQ